MQRNPCQSRNHGGVVSWNFELGGSLSKKCNGNHQHGPCAGRETKETQLYTSIIVGVILRRFRARARCLKPAPLKLALACITRGRSRKHQATASEICTTPTAQPRCWVSPEPLVYTGSLGSVPNPKLQGRAGRVRRLNLKLGSYWDNSVASFAAAYFGYSWFWRISSR